MARYTVVLDSCVLVPIALADTLLRIAERELYRPLWSDRILDEAMEAVISVHHGRPSRCRTPIHCDAGDVRRRMR